MQPNPAGGGWSIRVPLGRGRYEYAFLVNGRTVVPDPKALLFQDDGFGNSNSIINIGNNHEQSI